MARRELTLADIDRMDKKDILEWDAARKQELEDEAQAKREADDLALYSQSFVKAGGRPGDAKAAWQAERNRNAQAEASRQSAAATEYSRRRTMEAM